MNVIEVEAPGLQTTVQDLGREGFGAMGVSPSGAADPIALRIGNRLVGNAENAAALEMTLVGGTFRFREETTIALTGSDFGAELDGVAFQPWASVEVQAGKRFGWAHAQWRSLLFMRVRRDSCAAVSGQRVDARVERTRRSRGASAEERRRASSLHRRATEFQR